jgi:hypothetical protein
MDRYAKFILTMIAVGIFGLNYHLFKGEIISSAYADKEKVHKIAICNQGGYKCSTLAADGEIRIFNKN